MKKLLGIGINNFLDPSADLSGCVNDTLHVRQLSVDGPLKIDPTEIRLLCDERATRLNIFERLDWCGRGWTDPKPETDKLIIQASCHGSQVVDRDGDEVEDLQDEVLCPYDFPKLWDSPVSCDDAEQCEFLLGQMPKPQICDDDLAVFLKKIPEGVYTVLLIDSCHSGSVSRSLNPHGRAKYVSPPIDIMSRGMDRDLGLRRFGMKPTETRELGNIHYVEQRHVLLSGCRDNQTSADAVIDDVPQGAMTWSFLAALKELGYYNGKKPTWLQVHDMMLSFLSSFGYAQVPQLTGPKAWLEGPVFWE